MLSDVGFLPILLVSDRFAGRRRRRRRRGHGRRRRESPGVDRPGDSAKEAQTLLQVPDTGAREGVSLQRLRLEAEALGAGAQPEPDRASGEDMVPESAHEEQEEQPTPVAAAEQQQQQPGEQRKPPQRGGGPSSPGQRPRERPPRGGAGAPRQRLGEASSVTRGVLWRRVRPRSARLQFRSPRWKQQQQRRKRPQRPSTGRQWEPHQPRTPRVPGGGLLVLVLGRRGRGCSPGSRVDAVALAQPLGPWSAVGCELARERPPAQRAASPERPWAGGLGRPRTQRGRNTRRRQRRLLLLLSLSSIAVSSSSPPATAPLSGLLSPPSDTRDKSRGGGSGGGSSGYLPPDRFFLSIFY